jgi:response regulator of citrate/malate metabolism
VDLLIVDLAMPIMGGAELVGELRKARINSDVIVVTAANDVKHLSEMLKFGIIDYLVKPFDNIRFNQAIQKYLNKTDLLSVKDVLNQEDIDTLMNMHSTSVREIRKGIQPVTLEKIIAYLHEANESNHTCESLSAELSLSRVTIRRYLNYLVETDVLSNTIDYSTGGRPSIIYNLK